ncbi:hypothetical protein EYV96_16355 [Dyella terrae]|uniref:TraB/GumN family protein n=2 Tax=Dyella TaxID=231454 RepID=A0A4R0YDY3_9GAMM|nr:MULTISPECIES: DUF5694 domain-containing protein [Dyella]TBR36165.1 hypothetical protein EYV96_16355 [Dyella terrae]TCI06214.1 hypothetical protein EZM97_35445 [Dyella soli]
MIRHVAWGTLALLCVASAWAKGPVTAVPHVVPNTKVLVLGTVHLVEAPKHFQASSLDPVVDKLVAYKPQVVTVEQISGETCVHMAQLTTVYDPEDVRRFCADTSKAKAATGLEIIDALAQVQSTLKAWPISPTPAQRRHLAALFLASGDGTSAAVQWLQLPEAERHAGDGLDAALVDQLHGMATGNESYQIAARVAARSGLQRVYPVDDHTGDNLDITDARGYGKAIQAAWDSHAATVAADRKTKRALWDKGDMLGVYRFINRPEVLQREVDADIGAALGDTSPEHFGQMYVAGWESRNLRMVANVHVAFRETPGVRVLSVVGSQHKPWFDSLLGQMQGVEIVDVEKVLQ